MQGCQSDIVDMGLWMMVPPVEEYKIVIDTTKSKDTLSPVVRKIPTPMASEEESMEDDYKGEANSAMDSDSSKPTKDDSTSEELEHISSDYEPEEEEGTATLVETS